MKKVYIVIIIAMMVINANAQNSDNNMTGRTSGRNLHKTITRGNFMQENLNSRITPNLFLPGNTVYDHLKMHAVMQKLDNIEFQNYNLTTSLWENSSLFEFAYDANGHNTTFTYSDWNMVNNMYEPEGKTDYSYDANGYMTEQISKLWDATSNDWYTVAKLDYSYNVLGHPTLQYYYYWDESEMDWMLLSKEEYTYDGGKLTMVINYILDLSGTDWINNHKTEYFYNGSGYMTTSTDYTWDYMSLSWQNMMKTEYSYNGSNQLIMDIMYSWSVAGDIWVYDSKDEYMYDGNMNMTSNMYSIWNGSVWVDDGHDDYSYNNAYTYNELLLPWEFSQNELNREMTGHMLTLETGYDAGSLMPSYRNTYNYSSITVTGVAETPDAIVNVYPQPASVSVKLNWPANYQSLKLEVSDVSGKVISYQQVEKNKSISVQNLSPGIYLYRLLNNSNTLYKGKLLID
jgi:hypothetical protein